MTDRTNTNLFHHKTHGSIGIPTLIIAVFWLSTLVGAYFVEISIEALLSDTIKRAGMNGILVLAMVPAIQSGTGPNFALPIGIVCGLLAAVCAIELGLTGVLWLFASIVLSVPFAIIAGFSYGKLLNAVKGSEMTIATYTGFSITALMCLVWLVIPFNNPQMGWFMGKGLRETIQLDAIRGEQILNNFLALNIRGEILIPTENIDGETVIPTIINKVVTNVKVKEVTMPFIMEGVIKPADSIRGIVIPAFNIGDIKIPTTIGGVITIVSKENTPRPTVRGGILIPTGMLLFFGFFVVLAWLFFKSKTGIAISAGGINPKFAQASGLNIDRNRILANIFSTILGAIGIIIYSQSFGYVQLYTAPLMMAFPAVAAILIGGATASRASAFNAVIGVFLFQGLLTTALPVANEIFKGTNLSDMMRAIIQNGVILYALTQIKKAG